MDENEPPALGRPDSDSGEEIPSSPPPVPEEFQGVVYGVHLASGGFGTIYRAQAPRLNDSIVIIKIFNNKPSFIVESSVYDALAPHETMLVRLGTHDNLSGDSKLMLELHPNGSLRNYLSVHGVNLDRPLSMCRNIVEGLCHLHHNRPRIAHRDIKADNFLVKDDLSLCYADFGHSLRENVVTNANRFEPRVGTPRYMAPELLNEDYTPAFDTYLRRDVYSAALVMWEVLNMIMTNSPYKTAYAENTGDNPTMQVMRPIVCEGNVRPTFNGWMGAFTNEFTELLTSSWDAVPNNRPSAEALRAEIVAMNI